MLQALNLRSGPAAAGPRQRASAGQAGRGGHVGAGARWPVRPRRRRGDRAALAGQRAPRAHRRRARLPHRPGAGDQRRMAPVRRRRRLPRAAVVVAARLVTLREGGPDGTAVLERGLPAPAPGSATSRTFPPTNPFSTSRISRRRPTRRGRARGCPPKSSGRRRARGIRKPVQRRRFPWGASEPTDALANLGGDALRPARSARTRRAHRPTAPSRCSATYGSGPRRRCGRGPASPR